MIIDEFNRQIELLTKTIERLLNEAGRLEEEGNRRILAAEKRFQRGDGGDVAMGPMPPQPGQDPLAAQRMGDFGVGLRALQGQQMVQEAARLRGEAERIGLEKAALIRRRDAYITRVTNGP